MIVFSIIVFIMFLIIMAVMTLSIKIEIAKLNISNIEGKISKEFTSTVKIFIFQKITILKAEIDNERMSELNKKLKTKIADQIDKDILKKAFNPKTILTNRDEIKESLKKVHIKFERFILDLKIGTGELFSTILLVPTISTIISIYLSKKFDKSDYKNVNYNIEPIYDDSLLYDIKFKCIISVRVVHIIYMIYMLIKGKKESDGFGGTSNRKFNANCNV